MLISNDQGVREDRDVISQHLSKLSDILYKHEIELSIAKEYRCHITPLRDGPMEGLGRAGEYSDYIKIIEEEIETINVMKGLLLDPTSQWADKAIYQY